MRRMDRVDAWICNNGGGHGLNVFTVSLVFVSFSSFKSPHFKFSLILSRGRTNGLLTYDPTLLTCNCRVHLERKNVYLRLIRGFAAKSAC